jgi:glutathione synthase/RimK-type ligase-like ATP-grasp enzyme
MILLCGIPSEPPLALLLRELSELGAPLAVFNQRLFDTASLEFEVSDGAIHGSFQIGSDMHPLAGVQAVYARLMDDWDLPELRHEPPDSARRRQCRELHARLLEWLEITPSLVVTRAGPNASNGSKTYQAAIAAAQGFVVPETLVTNDPNAALAFCEQIGRVIYKSVSGIRSVVTEVREDDLLRLDAIRWCPVQFQEAVDGLDVRVHVVGEAVFATAVASDDVDYRYGEAELTAHELPCDLGDRCIALARALDIPFAGIDLRISPSGDVYCFEVNPSPAYSYYEMATGQPIARALASLLASKSAANSPEGFQNSGSAWKRVIPGHESEF